MSKIEKIKELTNELLYHCHLYYDLDSPIISDKEYDKQFDELQRLEDEVGFYLANSPTHKVQGKVMDGFKKVTHSKPMLSAAKTKNIEDIKKFIGKKVAYCSWKLDGLTLVVIYENGEFVQAITRGTGVAGEDVTEQAKMIKNLPMCIPYRNRLELRGECVVDWDTFNKINETLAVPYSHPRNLASGSLRNLDTNVTKSRGLSYVVFECVSDLANKKITELEILNSYGFETVDFEVEYEDGIPQVENCVKRMNPETYKYPVDGLIFEIDDKVLSKSMQSTEHHESCRMALKWADTTYETVLEDVEWNPTRTGLISPVAVFSPVDLDGAITTRATLHNVSIIKQLELGIGDTITVYRSNMVIPKIDDNLTRSNTLKIPDVCPCCGKPTVIEKTNDSEVLMCTNLKCTAKNIAKFAYFVSRKCMNIDGLSEKTLEMLISNGFIHNFKDIYHIKDHRNKLIRMDGYGPKSIDKLIEAIEKSRNVKFENFLTALGINGIGSSASKTISKCCNGEILKFLELWSCGFDWTNLDDIGEITAKSLNDYIIHNYADIVLLSDEMRFVVEKVAHVSDNPFTGKNVCVTGKLNSFTRDSINEKLVSLGAKPVGSVSKKTDYLICNEASSSSKYKKASELGIPVITEEQFKEMICE